MSANQILPFVVADLVRNDFIICPYDDCMGLVMRWEGIEAWYDEKATKPGDTKKCICPCCGRVLMARLDFFGKEEIWQDCKRLKWIEELNIGDNVLITDCSGKEPSRGWIRDKLTGVLVVGFSKGFHQLLFDSITGWELFEPSGRRLTPEEL